MPTHLVAGGAGENGRITAAAKDGQPMAELIAADNEAIIAAGQKGGRPGRITLYDGNQHATIQLTSANATVLAGGGGQNGTFTTRGKDGQPVVELLARDHEAIIGLGQVGRPGRISLYDAQQHEAIRIDAAKGDILLFNADCAEEFDVVADEEPGTVVVLADGGGVRASTTAYDTRVAGVVSGAGGYRPALVLDRQMAQGRRAPVALVGKVYCLADATEAPIRAGDLLTTSARAGHAMRAVDRERAFGAVLGKALRPLASGTGLIPILVVHA